MTSRAVKRTALVALVVVAGMVVLLLAITHSPWTRKYLLARLREEARAAGLSLDIDSLRYNLPAGSAELEGVTLRRAAPSGLPPFLTARRVRIDISTRSLLFDRSIEVDNGAIDGLAIHLVRYENGQTNLPESTDDKPRSDELPAFLISSLTATGSLTVEDRVTRFDAAVPEWKLSLTGTELPLRHFLRFDQTRTGTISYEGRQQNLDTLSLNANFDRRNATIEHLRVVTARSGVTLSGTMAGFGQPVVDFNTETRLHLQPLLTLAGKPDLAKEVEGIVLAKGQISGRLASPNVEADISTENVVTRRAGAMSLAADVVWTGSSGTLEIRSGSVRTPDATLGLQASWTGATPQSVNRANVRVERADLLALSRRFDLGTKVASTASGNAELEWRGTDVQAANGTLRLNLTSTQPPSPDVLPVSGTITARGRQRNFRIEAGKIQTLGSELQAKVAVSGERLSGTVNGNVADIGAFIPNLAAFLGERGAALRDQKAAGQAAVSAKLGGTVERPTADLTLTGSGIQYGPLEDVRVDVDAAYRAAQLTVTQARAAWKGSEVAASGRVQLEGARNLSFEARTNAVAIGEVLSALGRPMPIGGTVNATATGTGTVDNPQVLLNVQGSEMVAYGEQLGQLTSQATYANHLLDVKSLHLEKPENGGTLDAKGTLQTQTRDYTVEAQANAFAVRNLVVGGGQPVRGVVDLSATGHGNLDSPTLTLDLSAKEVEAAGRKLGTVQANATVVNSEATFAATAPSFNVKADGKAQLKAPYPVTLHANLQNTDLAKLPLGDSATPPVTGVITAEVRASAEAENWRQGEAHVSIANLRLDTPAGPVTNDGGIEAAYRNQTLEVAARLIGPKSTLSFEGSLPLEASAQPGTIRYNGAFDLTALEPWIADRTGLAVAGQATIQGSLTGTLERIEPAAQLTLTNGLVQGQSLRNPVENIQLDAALKDGTIVVRSLEASAAKGRVTAVGTIPLGLFPIPEPIVTTGAGGPAKFTLQATGFQIESLLKVPENVHTDLSLNVEMTADRPELNAVQATATFSRLNLDLAGIKLTPDAPPRIALRNGIASIEHFSLQGDGAHIQAAGSLDVNSKELRAVNLMGNFDAAILTSLSEDFAATGPVSFEMAAKGTLNNPQMTGFLEWTGGQAGMMTPPLEASDLNVRIVLADNQVRIERFEGELNGGTLTATGSLRIANGTIQDSALETTAENVYLEFPEGLQTRSTVKIRLVPRRDTYVLDGTVRIHEGSYTRTLDLQSELLQYVRNRGGVELIGERNEFLSRLRYNIAIQAREPIVMDNNLGELALTADLRLLGTYYRPGLAGRIELEEGGTLRLQENRYTIEQGTISFVNETRIEPQLDLTARTEVANREIGMRIYTEREGLRTDLTSDNPDDTRADILALLLTGRTAEKLEGRELSIIGEQAGMALLAGSITGRLSEQLTNTLGVSSVRLEPSLISAEKNPTARLTIGQDIATGLEFIYSMDLTNSSDQIYIVDYDVTRRFNARGTRQEDNTYRFDFQHDLRFGGLPSSEPGRHRREQREVRSVKFTGELVFPQETIADKFGIKPDKRYNFFKIRDGLDSLQSHYRKNNYLEAKVRVRQEQTESEVDLHVHIEAGPTVEFVYENWEPSRKLRDAVRDLWNRGVFDTQRLNKSVKAIRGTLAKDGYLRPEIMTQVRIPEMGRKTVTFEVLPGRRYDDVDLVFESAGMIDPSTIESQLERAKLMDRIATDPDEVSDFIKRYYHQEGFLDATVTGPEYDLNEKTDRGVIRFVIQEGPLYTFGAVNFHGAEVIPQQELERISNIQEGSFYSPKALNESRNTIEEAYWARGYRDVVLDYTLQKRPAEAEVDLNVTVQENQQSVVKEIEVAGNHVVSESFVRKQLVLNEGDALDYRRTARSRRGLYETAAFTSVDLREETITPAAEASNGPKYVRLVADVRERTPFQFRYGAFYDTERGPGFIADFSNRNSLGGGRLLGLRTRYDSDVREMRLYFSQPLLRQLPLRTDAATFQRRELRDAFITDRSGATIQQLLRLRERFELSYGYRIERTHTFDRVFDPDELFPFDEKLRIAPLTATLTRDTRNEVLDATRGSFMSHAFELSTATLGSHLRFMRYFGQYFKYFGLTDPEPVPFKGALELPRVIFASGVRLGLAHGLGGQEVIRSERFFAGGGTTVRGFGQDQLGPLDFLGQPAGGNAMLVLNNELRFPLFWLFEGVSFIDVGNVYPTIRDFRFGDLRPTGGFGLRVRTPYFLLRADYGAKFSPRPGEARRSWFFSIGQAF